MRSNQLELSGNQLSSIDVNTFNGLTKLVHLNKIVSFYRNSLVGLNELELTLINSICATNIKCKVNIYLNICE